MIQVLHGSRKTFRSRTRKNNFLNSCFTDNENQLIMNATQEYPYTTLGDSLYLGKNQSEQIVKQISANALFLLVHNCTC